MRSFMKDRRGVSNVIVFVLGLVIVTVIVANVFLWNFEMNQLDWEKMQEDFSIVNVTSITDTWSYNPSGYALGGSTTKVSGGLSDLTSDDGVYMTFRSYKSLSGWLSGWDKRVKITIDNNDVDSALSIFPVLVYLSIYSGRHNDDVTFVFDEVGANSKKIAVTTSDGTTECYVEIEKWDAASEQAWLWVKVPSISDTAETDLYLYYDADHADNTGYVGDPGSTPAKAVWDSYFKTVLHLHETSGTHYDSTSNSNDGTPQGGVTQDYATGEIDGADDFNGADGYIDFSTDFTAGQSEVTLELWTYLDEWVAGNTIYDAYYSGTLWQFSLLEGTWYTRDASTGSSGSRNNDLAWSNPGTTAWHHLALRYSVSGGVKAIYVDGSLEASTSTSIDTLTADRDDERLGYPCDGTYFDGKIDELRISTGIARSAAWIKATYETGRDDLLNFGPEDYVDQTCDLYPPSAKGTHSSFSAQQAGPDSIYDTLTEENTGDASNTTLIDAESFEGTWPPTGWTETGNWYKESNQAYDGTYSADFDGGGMGYSGDLTTPDLDCSDANAIYVDFWYRDQYLESSEFLLRYYDGSSWDTISDLGSTMQEDQWLHYQEKITDSQYFKSTFKVRWSAVDVESFETAFVDYVMIKKELQTYNYELDLEVQWTNADYDETNEELCIKTGTFSGSEDLQVKVRSGGSWVWVMNLTTNQWNNVSVTSYLTGSTFTIQFLGGTETSDTTQNTWDIDVTLIHVWSNEYSMEVEFTGSSNTEDWTQLNWTIDSAWTVGSVAVTLQLYNYTLDGYPASGNGYMSYTSSATANTDETKTQTVTVNPTHFRNATGYWKTKVKGVKSTDTQFDFKADWIEFKPINAGGTSFTFANTGSLTCHLVSLWILNSTVHQHYDIDVFINSGDTYSYIRDDIDLPDGESTVKVVTERGNVEVYSVS